METAGWRPPYPADRRRNRLARGGGILEELAGETEPPVVEAFLEVPGEADILDLPAIPLRACTGCRATRPVSIRATASG